MHWHRCAPGCGLIHFGGREVVPTGASIPASLDHREFTAPSCSTVYRVVAWGVRTGCYPAPSLRGVLFRMNWGSDRVVFAPRASVFGVCDERRPALRPMPCDASELGPSRQPSCRTVQEGPARPRRGGSKENRGQGVLPTARHSNLAAQQCRNGRRVRRCGKVGAVRIRRTVPHPISEVAH